LASKHGIHQTMVGEWKKQAVEGLTAVFSGRSEAEQTAKSSEAEVEKLHAKIGQLLVFPLSALDAYRHTHAAADAQRRQTLPGIAPRHLVQQSDQNTRSRCTDRMADGDRAAIHVHLRGVPAHLLVHRASLGG
jgi:transposase-like protein